jgi:carbonic anhydrase/acetyltransferase-like protein (isoleucine patch superfamily)
MKKNKITFIDSPTNLDGVKNYVYFNKTSEITDILLIHNITIIDEYITLHDVSLGDNVIIYSDATIGRCTIGRNSSIGGSTIISDDCYIGANSKIEKYCAIGVGVTLPENSIIDPFGTVTLTFDGDFINRNKPLFKTYHALTSKIQKKTNTISINNVQFKSNKIMHYKDSKLKIGLLEYDTDFWVEYKDLFLTLCEASDIIIDDWAFKLIQDIHNEQQ